MQPGDDVACFEADAEDEATQSEADLTGVFEGPDLVPVIHNVPNALPTVMNLYPDFLAGLKRITKLLSEKERKQQLIQTCFSDVPGVAWREEIQGFHGSVHEERWGTIAHAVKNVHAVSVPLKSCWSLDKFLGGRHAQASSRAEGEFGRDVVAVDRDLSSDDNHAGNRRSAATCRRLGKQLSVLWGSSTR